MTLKEYKISSFCKFKMKFNPLILNFYKVIIREMNVNGFDVCMKSQARGALVELPSLRLTNPLKKD